MDQMMAALGTAFESAKGWLYQTVGSMPDDQILIAMGAMIAIIVALIVWASALSRKYNDAMDQIDIETQTAELARKEADERIAEHEARTRELLEAKNTEASAAIKARELDLLQKSEQLDKLHLQKTDLLASARAEAERIIREAQKQSRELGQRADELLAQMQHISPSQPIADTPQPQSRPAGTENPTQS